MIINKRDKDLITKRVRSIMNMEGATGILNIDNLISTWESAKKEQLLDLFGGELILKREVKIEKEMGVLLKQIKEKLNCHISKLAKDMCGENVEIENYLLDLAWGDSIKDLIDNRISRDLVYTDKKGKKVHFFKGQRIMKFFSKLYSDVDRRAEFEEVRNTHSLILNDRYIKGTACLSIHPMDYLTLSDNDSGWNSCLSFDTTGSYRSGCIECLNSPNTIVAYVESSTTNYYFGSCFPDEMWNSKKYRQLIHIGDEFVLANKSYPFQSDAMTKFMLDWVIGLTNKSYKHEYIDLFKNNKNSDKIGRFFLGTELLYNDTLTNEGCLLKLVEDYDRNKNFFELELDGTPMCLCCGEEELYSTEEVFCDACLERECCDVCDNAFPSNELYEVEDTFYCEACLNNYCGVCDNCGELFELEGLKVVEEEDLQGREDLEHLLGECFCDACIADIDC